MLSIERYDAAEAEAIKRLNYPAIRAFKPAAFTLANFPARVSSEPELLRYADCMSELEDRSKYFEKFLYSRDEAYLMLEVSGEIEDLTGKLFDRPTQPYMSLFTPILVLRAVLYLASKGPATIWEIGPGSGYLGSYILRRPMRFGDLTAHHEYRSVDNTQALYLWQDRLFSHLANGVYKNYATQETPSEMPERAASLPWWQFAEMHTNPPKADIIVCDAAMGEMDTFAANYVVRIAAEMLRSSRIGAFVFRQIGEQRINSMDYIDQRFKSVGLQKAATPTVTVYSTGKLTVPKEFPPVGGYVDMRPAKDFLRIDPSKILESYQFFGFIKLHG